MQNRTPSDSPSQFVSGRTPVAPRFVLVAAVFALQATFVRATTTVQVTQAGDLTPESRVSAVTIYRQQALVSREARVTLPPGERRVVFSDLPSVADADSIRVS